MTGGSQTANNTTNVNVQGDTYQAQARNPVSTAFAPPLTAANGTCMGSTSGGAQGVGFGLSFGSTWTDSSCDMRYDAEALRAAGMQQAALARLCQKAEISQAMQAAGTPCPGANAAKSTQSPAPAPTAAGSASGMSSASADGVNRGRYSYPATRAPTFFSSQ
ncbi:MAG: hypothetical protein ACN6O3_01490 [Comamonas sp.]